MRIGIVGTGIAGLTAAWYLNRAGHHVTVFEKHASLGMDVHCVEFQIDAPARGTAQKLYCDVPPRMFNLAQWPQLWQLYRELEVEIQPVNPTKTFTGLGQAAVLKLAANYQPRLSAELMLNPISRTILKDIGRMMVAAPKFFELEAEQTNKNACTFAEYLNTNRYSKEFIHQFLFPALSSTVCTCSYASLNHYPASTLLRAMLKLVEPEGLFRTTHGTQDVVARLSKRFDEIHLNTSIQSVFHSDSKGQIETEQGEVFLFDHVVIATQANSAIGLVDGITDWEKEALGMFKYEHVETIVHTDESLMPVRRKDWSAFNMISNADNSAAMCTIHLNQFYPEWQREDSVFQTIMPFEAPTSETVITQAQMQRPVVGTGSGRGHEMLAQIHDRGGRRIWYCGSYASPGIPLLESGVSSAVGIAERILAPTCR